MANAKLVTTTTGVTLNLSPEEAETLRIVCRNIGGSPFLSRRLHTDAIEVALSEAGVQLPTETPNGVLDFKVGA